MVGEEFERELDRIVSRRRLASEAIDEFGMLLLAWTGAVSAEAAVVLAFGAAAESAREIRTRTVLDALFGAIPPAALRARMTELGVAPGTALIPYSARGVNRAASVRLARQLDDLSPSQTVALTAPLGDDIVGFVLARPTLDGGSGLVGIGSDANITGLPRAFVDATRALDTAHALGLEGVLSIEELGLLPAVVDDETVGESAGARYLEPLERAGAFGATLRDTLVAYLENHLRIEPTAEQLRVHQNTLRHRLVRYEQMTGADLRTVTNVIGVWWALTRAAALTPRPRR